MELSRAFLLDIPGPTSTAGDPCRVRQRLSLLGCHLHRHEHRRAAAARARSVGGSDARRRCPLAELLRAHRQAPVAQPAHHGLARCARRHDALCRQCGAGLERALSAQRPGRADCRGHSPLRGHHRRTAAWWRTAAPAWIDRPWIGTGRPAGAALAQLPRRRGRPQPPRRHAVARCRRGAAGRPQLGIRLSHVSSFAVARASSGGRRLAVLAAAICNLLLASALGNGRSRSGISAALARLATWFSSDRCWASPATSGSSTTSPSPRWRRTRM